MAKQVLNDYYTFSPSTGVITIPNRIIPRNQLLLVVNASSNTVLYNFSDPDLKLTSYTAPYNTTGTQFTLGYNTTAMSASDPLLIMEDADHYEIDFSEVVQDPTNKLRVAAPQSLIDTDFEYGTQGIKWESLALVSNIPSYFYKSGANSLGISSITGDGATTGRSVITITTLTPHSMNTGELISVNNTSATSAEGVFYITSIPSTTTFTYSSKGLVASSNIATPYSVAIAAARYNSNNISSNIIVTSIASDNASSSNAQTTGSVLTITTNGSHGLSRGTPIMLESSTTTSVNGSYVVYDVPSTNTFRVVTPNHQTGTTTPGTPLLYTNPEVIYQHRSSDGGVLITTNASQEGVAAVRQTRRYFRYQSGKGVQMSSGTKFTPSLDINSITQSGTSVTCTVQQPLTFSTGVAVTISGVTVNAGTTNYYNGTFTIQTVNPVARTFTYFTTSNSDTSPGGQPFASVTKFSSAVVRVGMFDFQNGFFYEYDGSTLWAVRRDSIKEGMGTVAVNNGNVYVTGTTTKFGKQLSPGDYIVIRGASYQVETVDSDTVIQISPKYRGATSTAVRFNITQDFKVPQNQWNMDRLDGSGPSGTVLDIGKMQMVYMDYTWYGAGTIRYGMRDVNGNVVYCHRIVNANRNLAAYLRSGNLPARYEVNNVGPFARLVGGAAGTIGSTLASSDGSLIIDDATGWPNAGTIIVQQGNNVEYMSYTSLVASTSLSTAYGTTPYTLQGLSRRLLGGTTSNVSFTVHEFDGGTAGQSSVTLVNYVGTNLAPVVSHWGTSVIMDGGFNDDRSIFFSYPKKTSFSINAGTSVAVLSLRLGPSVDNSTVAAFGSREIVNRMQLKLLNIDTNATGPLVISGVLNPSKFTGSPAPSLPGDWAITSIVSTIGAGSLAQLIDHTSAGVTYTGGEQIFSFYVDQGVVNYDLKDVRDLGNCVLGGEGSNSTPGYPNGPDVLTLVATNVSSGAVTLRGMRISWTEAQA